MGQLMGRATPRPGGQDAPPAAAEYVAARRVLLDALEALHEHRRSLVLIGSQAIYLHRGWGDLSVPPMTSDADLALEAGSLKDAPEISAVMRGRGFSPGANPGHWVSPEGVAIDLMVAPHQSGTSRPSARAARLEPHRREVARIAPGLACALLDHQPMTLCSLEPDGSDDREVEIEVAGPTALLVAKLVKVEERLEDAGRGHPGRVVDKDALDILRLLAVRPVTEMAELLQKNSVHPPAGDEVRRALGALRQHTTVLADCAGRAALGDPTVRPSLIVLAQRLLDALG